MDITSKSVLSVIMEVVFFRGREGEGGQSGQLIFEIATEPVRVPMTAM